MPPKKSKKAASKGTETENDAKVEGATGDANVFAEGELVLAYHGPLLYEAKVLKSKGTQYFLHYNGWNKKWDEWVDGARFLKDTEANRKKMVALRTRVNKTKTKGSVKQTVAEPKPKKRKRSETDDESVEADDERRARKEIKIKIPGALKRVLISDWEAIIRLKQIAKLPKKPCVNKILEDFLKKNNRRNKDSLATLEEVVKGIQLYFNRAIGTVLLYHFERPQYKEWEEKKEKKEFTDWCNIYGAEHLLRLFVKLPTLLAHTRMDATERGILQGRLADIVRFLDQNKKFFTDEYIPTDTAYHKLVEPVPS